VTDKSVCPTFAKVKKETVPFGGARIALNTIENEKIRSGFHDPRTHVAISCAP